MRAFTHYWDESETGGLQGQLCEGTPGKMFIGVDIRGGDRVYCVSYRAEALVLAAAFTAPDGEQPSTHEDQVVVDAADRSSCLIDFNRVVPDSIVRQLRFNDVVEGFIPESAGMLDARTLAGVRELSSESAQLLDQLVVPAPAASRRRQEHLIDGMERAHLLEAIRLYKMRHPHGFYASTKFDLIHEGNSYPPKAIVGLAGVPLQGKPFHPRDFTGGEDSKCFKVLRRCGFLVEPKAAATVPTADEDLLAARVKELMAQKSLPKPAGQKQPVRVPGSRLDYQRDPAVVAYVLQRAGDTCECCSRPAPFRTPDGDPFLEVHHIVPLTAEGEDTVENAVGICPNCHRECHHGDRAQELRHQLLQKVESLERSRDRAG